MLDQNKKILEAALHFLSLGISVIPVAIDKRPLLKWQKYQKIRATEDEVREWYSKWPDAQLAIVTGEISRLVVVDVDIKDPKYSDPKVLGLPDTTVIKSGSGGYHFYYTCKSKVGNKARINGMEIDLRASGGYIIAPPSRNEKGEYEYVKKTATLPDFPMSFIKEKEEKAPAIQQGALRRTQHNSGNSYNNFAGVSSGGRNHAMASYIGSLITKIHPQELENIAWPQVQQANGMNTPPLDERELRTTFDSMCDKERRGGSERFYDKKAKKEKEEEEFSKDKKPLSILPLRDLLSLPQINDDDVIAKMIPSQAITAITAETGIGKSILVWEMARYIATGAPFLDEEEFKTKKGKVLIVDQEMSEKEIRKRSHAILRDYPEAEIYFMKGQNFKIDKDKTYDELTNLIKENNIDVVILDTFSTIHTQEESSRDGMMEVNEKMMEIINVTGCSIVYIHHHRKQQEGSSYGNDSARGSSEIMAKVSSHLLFKRKGGPQEYEDEDGDLIIDRQFILSQKKSRGVDGFDSILIKSKYNYDKQKTSWEFIEKTSDKKQAGAKASESILEYLKERKGAEWSAGDMADTFKDLGLGTRNIGTALKQMRIDGDIIFRNEGRKYFYKYKEMDISDDDSSEEVANELNRQRELIK